MAVTIKGNGQVVVQVQSTTLTSQFTVTSASFTNVTGLSVSITPTNAANKILIFCNLNASSSEHSGMRVTRNGTAVGVGVPTGSQTAAATGDFYYLSNSAQVMSQMMNFLDSPSTTSAVTYQVQVMASSATLVAVNTNPSNINANYTMNGASTITVMEIAYS
jgi:hypothetical protein